MSLILDLSKYSTDELTALINEATSLRADRAKQSEQSAQNGDQLGTATLVAPTPPQGKDEPV